MLTGLARLLPPPYRLSAMAALVLGPGCSTVRTPYPPPANPAPAPAVPASPHFQRVLIVVLENQNYLKAAADPYLAELSQAGFSLTGFYALFHPSYPNYLAMVSGKELRTRGDAQDDYPDRTIADLLHDRGLSWKNYAENYPGGCFTGAGAGKYARKHVPFLSFTRVRATQCDRVVDAKEFQDDLERGELPVYMFYSPNLDNDGHDPVLNGATGLRNSSRWLRGFLEPLRADTAFMARTLVVITYDESRSDPNHIYTVLLGGGVRRGTSALTRTHFDLLRTIEWNFGLPPLAAGDSAARPIAEAWGP